MLADSVGLAMLVVLGSLRPDERLAFVLHDMFAVPFAEIGQILDRSSDAVKMMASRARRKVQDVPPPTGDRRRKQEQREVVDAFLAAARDGDFEALLRVLDPDVTLAAVHGRRRDRRGRIGTPSSPRSGAARAPVSWRGGCRSTASQGSWRGGRLAVRSA